MVIKRVLLTGGSGMVGRNILEHPASLSFEIIAPDRSELNLLGKNAVEDFIDHYDPDIIIHSAGRVGGIQANVADQLSFFLDNMEMGKNLVLGAKKVGIRKFLNLGSSCMYPRDATNPLTEDKLLKGMLEPTNEGYALAKIVVSRLCDYVSQKSNKLNFKTIIPCNLFGRYDNFDPKKSHMVPAIFHKLHTAKIESNNEVEIWGDGSARREFMYVGDLADCIWRCVKEFDSLPNIMNVGLGHDFSVNEYYRHIAEVVGYNGSFTHNLNRPVGMKEKLVSIDQCKSWGWNPTTDQKHAYEETYKYYLELRKNA